MGKSRTTPKRKRKISKPLPPPFDKIKQSNTGTIFGKEINMTGSLQKAVTKRLEKAQDTWQK